MYQAVEAYYEKGITTKDELRIYSEKNAKEELLKILMAKKQT